MKENGSDFLRRKNIEYTKNQNLSFKAMRHLKPYEIHNKIFVKGTFLTREAFDGFPRIIIKFDKDTKLTLEELTPHPLEAATYTHGFYFEGLGIKDYTPYSDKQAQISFDACLRTEIKATIITNQGLKKSRIRYSTKEEIELFNHLFNGL